MTILDKKYSPSFLLRLLRQEKQDETRGLPDGKQKCSEQHLGVLNLNIFL